MNTISNLDSKNHNENRCNASLINWNSLSPIKSSHASFHPLENCVLYAEYIRKICTVTSTRSGAIFVFPSERIYMIHTMKSSSTIQVNRAAVLSLPLFFFFPIITTSISRTFMFFFVWQYQKLCKIAILNLTHELIIKSERIFSSLFSWHIFRTLHIFFFIVFDNPIDNLYYSIFQLNELLTLIATLNKYM